MKALLSFFFIISGFSAQAGTFSSLKLDKIFNSEERAEWSIVKVNLSAINWGKIIREMENGQNKNCGEPIVNVGRTEALNTLAKYYNESELVYKLKPLVKNGQIVKAISAFDGSDGDSEYCSRSSYKIFAKDGEVLIIDYDYNT